jgi:MoaA/NifB/PqqE/SkfB family radical SAM enzyme
MPAVNGFALEIIERCNYYCKFCIRSSSPLGLHQLSFVELEGRLNILRKYFNNSSFVALTGGEPFLHPQLNMMLNLIGDCGISCSLTTNGSVFSDDYFDSLKRNNIFTIEALAKLFFDKIAQKMINYP